MNLVITVTGPASDLAKYTGGHAGDFQDLFYCITTELFGDRVQFHLSAMEAYICSFEMDGTPYGCHIEAESHEDAEQRVAAMRESLRLDGKLEGVIPAD